MSTDFVSYLTSKEGRPVVVLTALVALLTVSYYSSLKLLMGVWDSPEYGHGWIIPLLTLCFLWLRRKPIQPAPAEAIYAGLALLAVGLGMRLWAAYVGIVYLDMISFLPSLFGVFLMVGGWRIMPWAGPAIGFLIFMYPLPGDFSRGLLAQLQKVATVASTYTLQTLGVACYREGNRIEMLGLDQPLGVVEQCSGLRMLTIFIALSVAVVLITDRAWWQRIVILLSAIPIALIVNIIRIVGTAILYNMKVDSELANRIFHDFAGYIMMPIALGFMFLLLQVLDNVFIEEEDLGPAPVLAAAGRAGPKPVKAAH